VFSLAVGILPHSACPGVWDISLSRQLFRSRSRAIARRQHAWFRQGVPVQGLFLMTHEMYQKRKTLSENSTPNNAY